MAMPPEDSFDVRIGESPTSESSSLREWQVQIRRRRLVGCSGSEMTGGKKVKDSRRRLSWSHSTGISPASPSISLWRSNSTVYASHGCKENNVPWFVEVSNHSKQRSNVAIWTIGRCYLLDVEEILRVDINWARWAQQCAFAVAR